MSILARQRKHCHALKHTRLLFPTSCYVSGISCASLSSAMDGDAINATCEALRYLQRAVAGSNFYGIRDGRFDSILITKSSFDNSMKRDKNNIAAG